MKTFGELLAELRKRKGLSQNALAQIIKTNPTHISKIERGERNPPKKSNLLKIASALRLDEGEKIQLFIAAGYVIAKDIVSARYSYPLSNSQTIDLPAFQKKGKRQYSPAINQLIETLNDSAFTKTQKKEIEDKISSFLNWLREEIRKKR